MRKLNSALLSSVLILASSTSLAQKSMDSLAGIQKKYGYSAEPMTVSEWDYGSERRKKFYRTQSERICRGHNTFDPDWTYVNNNEFSGSETICIDILLAVYSQSDDAGKYPIQNPGDATDPEYRAACGAIASSKHLAGNLLEAACIRRAYDFGRSIINAGRDWNQRYRLQSELDRLKTTMSDQNARITELERKLNEEREYSARLRASQASNPSTMTQPAPQAASGRRSAGTCVRQTLIGAVNIWKYTNTCSERVEITVTRTCTSSNPATAGSSRSVNVTIDGGQTLDFDRQRYFANFCEALLGNSSTEGITAQFFK